MHPQGPPWQVVALVLVIIGAIGTVNLLIPERIIAWQIRRLQRPRAKLEFRIVGGALVCMALLFSYLFATHRFHY